jgi:hypothetical protein
MGVINPGTCEVPNGITSSVDIDSEYDILEIRVATSVPMLITGGPFSPQIGTGGVKLRIAGAGSTFQEGTLVNGQSSFNICPLPLAKKRRNTIHLSAYNNSGGAGYVHFWIINSSGNI